jgi:hypothetical protein
MPQIDFSLLLMYTTRNIRITEREGLHMFKFGQGVLKLQNQYFGNPKNT